MTKIFNYQSVLVLIGIVLLLVGCSGEPTTPIDAFKRSEKGMKKLNSVQVEEKEILDEVISNNKFKIDLENNVMIYEHNADGLEISVQGDEATVKHSSGNVDKERKSEGLKTLKEGSSFQLAPLDIFQQLDEEIIDEFTMETKNDEIVLIFDKISQKI